MEELEIQLLYHEKRTKKNGQYNIAPKMFSTEGSLDPALISSLVTRATLQALLSLRSVIVIKPMLVLRAFS